MLYFMYQWGLDSMVGSLILGVFLTLEAIRIKYVSLFKHQVVKANLQEESIYF